MEGVKEVHLKCACGSVVIIPNLWMFCATRGLHYPTMVNLARNRIRSHEGYTLVKLVKEK